jgi:hypothetical protein
MNDGFNRTMQFEPAQLITDANSHYSQEHLSIVVEGRRPFLLHADDTHHADGQLLIHGVKRKRIPDDFANGQPCYVSFFHFFL